MLEKRLRKGEAGEVEIVTITCRDPAPPPVSYIERSGGLYRDMMIHDFDMSRFLLGGEEIEIVHALGGNMVDPAIGKAGDIDTARGAYADEARRHGDHHQFQARHLWP